MSKAKKAPAEEAKITEQIGDTERQLLFYAQLALVNAERHHDWCVELGHDYAFARTTNSVPLTRVEFARAARDYPIVFAGQDQNVFPLAVLGLEDQQNLFIDAQGKWQADYLPAFVRRYPFVFSTLDEGQNFTLCIDEAFSGCNQEGRGERLFDDEQQKTQYLDNVLAVPGGISSRIPAYSGLCQTYEGAGFTRTRAGQCGTGRWKKTRTDRFPGRQPHPPEKNQ